MCRNLSLLCLVLSLLFGCSKSTDKKDSETQILLTQKPDSQYLKIHSVRIPLDDESLSSYSRGITAFKENGSLKVMAYNFSTRCLDLFDLTHQSISHISIEGIEKSALLEVFALDAITLDTIFAYSYLSLFILNGAGEIIEKKDLKVEYEGKKGFLLGDIDSRPFYDSVSGDIYGLLKYDNDEDRFNSPIAVKLNIKTGKYEVLPLYLDQEYKDKFMQLGYNNQFQISFYKDCAVYNYSYSSTLYVYDYQSGEVTSYTEKDNKVPSFEFVSQESSRDELMSAYIKNASYAQPLLYNDEIVQFIWGAGTESVYNKRNDLRIASLSDRYVETEALSESGYQISSVQLVDNNLIINGCNSEKQPDDNIIIFDIIEL